jgi:hypothetical protein
MARELSERRGAFYRLAAAAGEKRAWKVGDARVDWRQRGPLAVLGSSRGGGFGCWRGRCCEVSAPRGIGIVQMKMGRETSRRDL